MTNLSFLNFEMADGTKKLAEALFLRGFPVQMENDFISLRNGSERDYAELKWLLERLAIPVFWNGKKFQLLVTHFPYGKMRQIVRLNGIPHSVDMSDYHYKWKTFVNRRFGIRTSTLQLCPYTAILVKALNEAGIVALTGCNGHGRHSPNVRLSGVYFGVWFSLIQEKYLQHLRLHYSWQVEYTGGKTTACIIANKATNEPWDMLKVLDDCRQMAEVLVKHAAEIRALKRQTFKRSMKEIPEKYRLSRDMHGLRDWMKQTLEHRLNLSANQPEKVYA